MENPVNEKSTWIQELSNQSWNLELVISGAAIFSTSFLPELCDQAIANYFQDYQLNNEIIGLVLPALAFSFAKASAYLLISTFVLHFILRAFWIAVVGLRAVFPQGINYEKLPNTNDNLKELYKKQFGTVDDYIVRLDKRCSQIFSIAFLLVLFSFMIAFGYIIIFLSTVGFKTYLPEIYQKTKFGFLVTGAVLFVFAMLMMVVTSNKKLREHAVLATVLQKYVKISSLLFMGMYKPIMYLNFTFASNLPRKKYYTSSLLIMITFFVIALSFYVQKLLTHNGIPVLESRNYFSSGSQSHKLNGGFYANQRMEDDEVADAMIQSDVIDEAYIKLFINYKKVLDADLAKFCVVPVFADTLMKSQKRIIKDSTNLVCLQQYFQLTLNDTTLQNVEYLFEENSHLNAKGLRTYISTETCKTGRNMLQIKRLETDSLPKRVWKDYLTVPFWYAKN